MTNELTVRKFLRMKCIMALLHYNQIQGICRYLLFRFVNLIKGHKLEIYNMHKNYLSFTPSNEQQFLF
jgi:hypothetical protein